MSGRAVIAFAKEVYAACATVGYASETVTRLKRLIDASEDGDARVLDALDAEVLGAAALAAQHEAIAWAGRPQR